MLQEILHTASYQVSGDVLFLLVAKSDGTPVVSSYGTQHTVAAGGPAFPFFIKKRKQEIECKTL